RVTGWRVEGLSADRGGFRLGPIDFDLGDGEVLAVLGPSGAGKTTLLRGLAGFQPLVRGRISRDSLDVTGLPPEQREIGFVPQGLALIPDRTVARNIAYPMELRGSDRDGAALDRLIGRFGLQELRERRPMSLSTGEQQRVAIARALAARPRLLLWDEPLAALDLLGRDDLIEELREVQRTDPLPIVIVTHDPTIAFSLADRLLLLHRGSVVFLGEPEVLIRTPPDPFAARFVGVENVYTPAQLDRTREGPFADHLRSRAGPAGVGIRGGGMAAPASSATWTARARRVSASPNGWRCEAEIEGLPIRISLPSGRSVRPGDPVTFSLDAADVVALGLGREVG
ncbi:MAG: ABC transporter ATP-binding protein, partial [Thermoplasmata archaeon]|nr:ABC transporter ATP-binding protein [Thermoplasmata archaeon]